MEEGVRRWLVNISKWCPSPQDFSSALSLFPPSQRSSILRFIKSEDRKRALVSRLLQYALLHQVLGIPYEQISIKRTLEGKPYLECDKDVPEFPNFNFNVSHHGDYVAIASEPLCLVGLDMVSCTIPWKETVTEFIQNFSSYFSRLEWDFIIGAGNEEQMLVEFYRYWCLKEAYVKAIGSGLASGLDRVEFHHTGWTNINVKIDGTFSPLWKFWLLDLGEKHYVSLLSLSLSLSLTNTKFSAVSLFLIQSYSLIGTKNITSACSNIQDLLYPLRGVTRDRQPKATRTQ
ncbi:L-aminoadipate-semialdehyde dehydrogenase-phosphopantetheinyl transferase-like isoform X1 [Rhodamnia argentea]|uniref:holo-[acyl-carrier-protein] synthase n=1 Tax=Rhodamnia argentea TaxID=178133 RepID=A0ABM3HTP0_9MYRT|nr:L-aminoadipate-semialdehyde dehydrogenase-phosphopantetheinyl transferase-like isoform X1 [Rhodamnia argentea]